MMIDAFLDLFPRRRQNSPTDWHVPCPAHDDNPNDPAKFSLHVTLTSDRIVIKCFAGCESERVLHLKGLTWADLFLRSNGASAPREEAAMPEPTPTLDAFASLKQIKLSVLEEAGWRNHDDGLAIPYQQRDGSLWRWRYRTSMRPGAGFKWDAQKDRALIPYGRHRLDQVMEKGELWLVEGESDAVTAWARGLPCLGLPGNLAVKALTAKDLIGIETLWIVREPGQSGDGFLSKLRERLPAIAYAGTARVVSLPAKDLSDLHVLKGREFWPAIKTAQQDAVDLVGTASPRSVDPVAVELTALMARHYPEDHGLVAGLLVRRGLAVGGGAPKLGKSSLFLNLVLQRARGVPWLGFATEPGTTLVVQSEIPEPELQKRLSIMLKDSEPPTEGTVHFLTDRRIKLDRADGLALLRAQIERVKPDLLLLDPLARFMTGDESATRDMGAIIAVLDLLIQEYGLTILLVHHVGKPSGKPGDGRDGGNRLRGSSALFAAADSVLMLDRADDGFKLTFELRHAPEPAPLYLTRTPTLWFAPAGPPADLLAVAYLVASGPLRWSQFVTVIKTDRGVPKRTAERLLDRTKKAGLIASDAEGYYTATATYRQHRPGGEATV